MHEVPRRGRDRARGRERTGTWLPAAQIYYRCGACRRKGVYERVWVKRDGTFIHWIVCRACKAVKGFWLPPDTWRGPELEAIRLTHRDRE